MKDKICHKCGGKTSIPITLQDMIELFPNIQSVIMEILKPLNVYGEVNITKSSILFDMLQQALTTKDGRRVE